MSNCHIWEEQGERSLQITRKQLVQRPWGGVLGKPGRVPGVGLEKRELTATEESGEINMEPITQDFVNHNMEFDLISRQWVYVSKEIIEMEDVLNCPLTSGEKTRMELERSIRQLLQPPRKFPKQSGQNGNGDKPSIEEIF